MLVKSAPSSMRTAVLPGSEQELQGPAAPPPGAPRTVPGVVAVSKHTGFATEMTHVYLFTGEIGLLLGGGGEGVCSGASCLDRHLQWCS